VDRDGFMTAFPFGGSPITGIHNVRLPDLKAQLQTPGDVPADCPSCQLSIVAGLSLSGCSSVLTKRARQDAATVHHGSVTAECSQSPTSRASR
jgi:hypothetical protein